METSPRHQKTILCIDDYKNALAGWCLYLQGVGYRVMTAADPTEGLQLFGTNPIDAVVLDYAMPEINGGQCAETMKHMKPEVRILMLSGQRVPEKTIRSVDAFVVKGQHPGVLLAVLDKLLGIPQSSAGTAA